MTTDREQPVFGEVFEDGQFRGSTPAPSVPPGGIVVGDYIFWSLGHGDEIGITFRPTGEMGVFKTADFEPYVKAFFGLNF